MSGRRKRNSVTVDAGSRVPVGPGDSPTLDATTLDFGHHAGRTIEELCKVDPDYLRWLASHPSGARYRTEIARVAAAAVVAAEPSEIVSNTGS